MIRGRHSTRHSPSPPDRAKPRSSARCRLRGPRRLGSMAISRAHDPRPSAPGSRRCSRCRSRHGGAARPRSGRGRRVSGTWYPRGVCRTVGPASRRPVCRGSGGVEAARMSVPRGARPLGQHRREGDLRASLELCQSLGAEPLAQGVASRLRQLGARNVPRGPRTQTRTNPAGLTSRELEVLELLGEGLRNAEIAARLVVSVKTVGNHVSAILRKLGVPNRAAAAEKAAQLEPKDREAEHRVEGFASSRTPALFLGSGLWTRPIGDSVANARTICSARRRDFTVARAYAGREGSSAPGYRRFA